MSAEIRIVELIGPEDFRRAWPVMRQLRPYHSEDSFVQVAGEMADQGYRLFAATEDGEIRALAGVAVCLNLYHGRHLWVYDLVTDEAHRSRGFGERLLGAMDGVARAEGCERVALCSGVQRLDAHRFYEQRMGYTRASHLFTRELPIVADGGAEGEAG